MKKRTMHSQAQVVNRLKLQWRIHLLVYVGRYTGQQLKRKLAQTHALESYYSRCVCGGEGDAMGSTSSLSSSAAMKASIGPPIPGSAFVQHRTYAAYPKKKDNTRVVRISRSILLLGMEVIVRKVATVEAEGHSLYCGVVRVRDLGVIRETIDNGETILW